MHTVNSKENLNFSSKVEEIKWNIKAYSSNPKEDKKEVEKGREKQKRNCDSL